MKKIWIGLLCIILIGIMTGCARKEENSTQKDGYTVEDSRGKILNIKEKPQRIISTYVFADEILLDLVSHDRIIGLDKWIHDPGLSMAAESANDIPYEVGDSVEYMVSLHPDLVILSEKQTRMAASLESTGIPVFVYKDAKIIQDIPDTIRALGKAVHEPERAEAMVRQMEDRLAVWEQKVNRIPDDRRKKGMLVLRFGAIGGDGTIFHDVLTRAGVIDAYDEVRPLHLGGEGTSMILSKEEFIKSDPDIIIMGNWSQGGVYKDSRQQLEEMYNDPAYSSMKAIQKRNVVIIPQKNVNCLSHHVVEGIAAVYQAVYGQDKAYHD